MNPPAPLQLLVASTFGRGAAIAAQVSEDADVDVLLVNQQGMPETARHTVSSDRQRTIDDSGTGIARSRNIALDHASSPICLFTDEDIVLSQDFAHTILSAFDEHPSIDILSFCIQTPQGRPFMPYPLHPHQHTRRTLLRVSSVEIAFRTQSIRKHNLRFDERFGLGARWPVGEEVIFLYDALANGLSARFVPTVIGCHPSESSGKQWGEVQGRARGALFTRLFGHPMGLAAGLALALKKYPDVRRQGGMRSFLKATWQGTREFTS